MNAIPDDKAPQDPLSRVVSLGLSNGVAFLSFAGVAAYALGRICYIAFYAPFGISPDDVGIDQARSVEAAGLLLVAACIAVASAIASDAATDRARPGWKSTTVTSVAAAAFQAPAIIILTRAGLLGDNGAVMFAALLAVVIGLFFVSVAIQGGYSAPDDASQEQLPGKHALHRFLAKFNALQLVVIGLVAVGSGSVVSAWQFGVRAEHSGSFSAAPFSAIRVDHVCLTPVTGALPAPVQRDRPYARLGSANGVLVLFDTKTKVALRLPETSVVAETIHRVDGHLTCP